MENIIKVGVWVLLINTQWKILYGLRKSKHGKDTYGPPGWHLEFGESIEACAVRELYEESWIRGSEKDVLIYCALNEIYPNNEKHYINIITLITNVSWDPENKEPEKLGSWQWMSWDEIKNLWEQNFFPMQNFIKKYPDFNPFT